MSNKFDEVLSGIDGIKLENFKIYHSPMIISLRCQLVCQTHLRNL